MRGTWKGISSLLPDFDEGGNPVLPEGQTIHTDFSALALGPREKPLPSADITVVITCHDYGRYLALCLESILSQSLAPGRIVVWDDASSDDTAAVAAAFADRGVEYRRVEFGNVCPTRNAALADVRTPWVLFVDADNTLHKHYLLNMWTTAQQGSVAALALVYPAIDVEGPVRCEFLSAAPFDYAGLRRWNIVDTCSLIRTEALRSIGGWPPNPNEDWGIALRLSQDGWQLRPCPGAVLRYRAHAASLSLTPEGHGAKKALMQNATLTLLTVFSGREWALPRYFAFLENMDCQDERTELYFIDNSRSPAFHKKLQTWLLKQRRFTRWRYEEVSDICDAAGILTNAEYASGGGQERLVRDPVIHTYLARLYGRAFGRQQSDFVLCVEDDIIPPDDVYPRLLDTLIVDDAVHASHAVVVARQWLKPMITYLPGVTLPEGQELPAEAGAWEVLSAAAACCLWRGDKIRALKPRYGNADRIAAVVLTVTRPTDTAG